jgi:hypothetical protein
MEEGYKTNDLRYIPFPQIRAEEKEIGSGRKKEISSLFQT